MASRLELHTRLEEILGSSNCYFQPPGSPSPKMSYPAIKYKLSGIDKLNANNRAYNLLRSYEVIVIVPDPDSEIPNKVLQLPMCRFNRYYTADNLNHYVFTLYY